MAWPSDALSTTKLAPDLPSGVPFSRSTRKPDAPPPSPCRRTLGALLGTFSINPCNCFDFLYDKLFHSYAAICQSEGLVPIVEPEILMDGPHSIEHCAKVTEEVLSYCYKALADNHVLLEGTMLKPNMICPGSESSKACTTAEMAYHTGTPYLRSLPGAFVKLTLVVQS
jgi:hypothetical protein